MLVFMELVKGFKISIKHCQLIILYFVTIVYRLNSFLIPMILPKVCNLLVLDRQLAGITILILLPILNVLIAYCLLYFWQTSLLV